MVARSVSFIPSTSIVSPDLVAPEAVIWSMRKKRGPFKRTVTAPKRFLMASSVMASHTEAGQPFSPRVL